MYKVIIENDNFNVKVVENNSKETIINASIDIFNIKDDVFKGLLGAINDLNNVNIDNVYLLICAWYGEIPKHSKKYSVNGNELKDTLYLKNYNLSNLNDLEAFNKNIKVIKKSLLNKKKAAITTYYCDNKVEIAIACIYHYTKYGHSLRKCECCNQYFISLKKQDEKYCVRLNDNKKTCREIMAHKSRIESQNKEPRRTERNVYNNLLKNADENTLNRFMNERNLKKQDYQNNKITLEEYITFLKSFNKHKKN